MRLSVAGAFASANTCVEGSGCRLRSDVCGAWGCWVLELIVVFAGGGRVRSNGIYATEGGSLIKREISRLLMVQYHSSLCLGDLASDYIYSLRGHPAIKPLVSPRGEDIKLEDYIL